MNKGVRGLVIRAFALCVVLLPCAAHAQVVISEVMYNPKGSDTGREWVELFNSGSSDAVLVAGTVKGSWRIADTSNHTLTDPSSGTGRGSLTIPASGYLILTSDPSSFISEYPGGSYAVVKSSISLSNTGSTVSIMDGNGTTVDTMSYNKDMGGNDDGTSLQKSSGGWIAALPTPGMANATSAFVQQTSDASSTATSTQQSTQTQIPVAPTNSYVPPPKPSLYADAGDDRSVIVGADVQFDARAYDKNQNVVDTARFSWNFGDGGTAEGESVLHHFSYPGQYVVVLNIARDKFAASDQIVVTAEPASLVFGLLPHGGVEIVNKSGHTLDLSDWVVKENAGLFAHQFMLPEHSLILAGASMRIASEILSFSASPLTMLEYPNGTLAQSVEITDTQSVQSKNTESVSIATAPRASTSTSAKATKSTAKRQIVASKNVSSKQQVPDEKAPDATASSTGLSQPAAVATAFPLRYTWILAVGTLVILVGLGVITARRVKKREWDIVEDTSD